MLHEPPHLLLLEPYLLLGECRMPRRWQLLWSSLQRSHWAPTRPPCCPQVMLLDDDRGEGERPCSCFEPVLHCIATGQPGWVSCLHNWSFCSRPPAAALQQRRRRICRSEGARDQPQKQLPREGKGSSSRSWAACGELPMAITSWKPD